MGVYDLPILSSGAPTYVVDPVSAISAANEGKLNKDLKNLAEKTGQEVRMVVVRRLDYGQKIDNLADDILREWYPNPEDRANQTIIVLDTLTNKTAIRVGEEAKPLLTDVLLIVSSRKLWQFPSKMGENIIKLYSMLVVV